MNNVIMRKVVVAASFLSLTTKESEVASAEISAPPTNSGPVFFLGDDGSEVPWVPGEYHQFQHVDLAGIKVKGNPGDLVTIVGGTW